MWVLNVETYTTSLKDITKAQKYKDLQVARLRIVNLLISNQNGAGVGCLSGSVG